MAMQATSLSGRINPDMTDDVIPIKETTRKGVIDQLKNSPNGGIYLRPRRDMDQFDQRDHVANRAGQAVAQFAKSGCVQVVIDRPVVPSRHGNKERPTYLTIHKNGTLVTNIEMAVGILDRYPTCVEEVPDGEVVRSPDARDLEIAKLRAQLAGDADADGDTEEAAPVAVEPKQKKRRA